MTYKAFVESVETDNTDADLIAYMKLRIICAALNEGWKPRFTYDECRYYPWIRLYTKDEVDSMDEDERNRLVLFGGDANYGAYAGFAGASSSDVPSNAIASVGSRLCLRNRDLAIYCGNQFIDIWTYFLLNNN